MKLAQYRYPLIMVLVFLLLTPMSAFAESKKNSKSETPSEDPSGWYAYAFAWKKDKCQPEKDGPLGAIKGYNLIGVKCEITNEIEKEGKVINAQVVVYGGDGSRGSIYFVRGKKECDAELANAIAMRKKNKEYIENRYK